MVQPRDGAGPMGQSLYKFGIFLVAAFLLVFAIKLTAPPASPRLVIDYSRFLADVDKGKVETVAFSGGEIQGIYRSGERFTTFGPPSHRSAMVERLVKHKVAISAFVDED